MCFVFLCVRVCVCLCVCVCACKCTCICEPLVSVLRRAQTFFSMTVGFITECPVVKPLHAQVNVFV